MMGYLKFLILSMTSLIFLIFVAQNIEQLTYSIPIQFNFLFIKITPILYPIYLIVLLAFFIGFLITFFLNLSKHVRMRNSVKVLVRQIKELSNEVDLLRKIPFSNIDCSNFNDVTDYKKDK